MDIVDEQGVFQVRGSKDYLVFVEFPGRRVDLVDDVSYIAGGIETNVDVYLLAIGSLGAFDVAVVGPHLHRPGRAVRVKARSRRSDRVLDRDIEALELDVALLIVARLFLALGRLGLGLLRCDIHLGGGLRLDRTRGRPAALDRDSGGHFVGELLRFLCDGGVLSGRLRPAPGPLGDEAGDILAPGLFRERHGAAVFLVGEGRLGPKIKRLLGWSRGHLALLLKAVPGRLERLGCPRRPWEHLRGRSLNRLLGGRGRRGLAFKNGGAFFDDLGARLLYLFFRVGRFWRRLIYQDQPGGVEGGSGSGLGRLLANRLLAWAQGLEGLDLCGFHVDLGAFDPGVQFL